MIKKEFNSPNLTISLNSYRPHPTHGQKTHIIAKEQLVHNLLQTTSPGKVNSVPGCWTSDLYLYTRFFIRGLKNMRKFFLAATAAVAVFSMSAANAAIQPNQLTVWINYDKGYEGVAQVGEKFFKRTGIRVKVEHPDEMAIQFIQEAATKNGPDIIMWAHDRFGDWATTGLLTPLSPGELYQQKFADFAWDAVTIGDKIYGYPVSIESISLICNKALVPQAPENFEEFIKLDDELKAKGARAILWDYNQVYYTYPLMASQGGYSFKKVNGNYDIMDTGINNAGSRTAIEFVLRLINEDHLQKNADYNMADKQFVEGKLGCILNGPWSWDVYDQAKIDFSVNPMPKFGGIRTRPFVGVQALGINAASPNKDLAINFIENYLLTDDGLKAVNDDKDLGAVALKSFEAILGQNPRLAVTMDNCRNGDVMPSLSEMDRFWSATDSALKQVFTGRQKLEQAMKIAEKRLLIHFPPISK